ncbi:class I SAM-dependent methyltransferase [Streptomyces sp. NBC_00576]|uniref:class I SAM-dependent methyltransferase n=1 Tax=Streptomyces sp. NBC_00576 TaxID=2903665 RepID=UPI002E812F2D|nr:class I SAM-dependent methyltransferase [Streptomyces sp. NBC_00576]WUB74881.1 class I SAM-dependent methyltransferase [Streptomyces sp. NBC_00576]
MQYKQAVVPWDIGEPQQAVVALENAGAFSGDVLDAGCGVGDNAVYLAGRGYRVTGFDYAATALRQAEQRADALGFDVEFVQSDAMRLDNLPQKFDTVLDSGLYHSLARQQRAEYAAALPKVCRPNALLHLLCFSDEVQDEFPDPHGIGEAELRNTFTGTAWRLAELHRDTYVTAFTREYVEKQAGEQFPRLDTRTLTFDTAGRLTRPIWRLAAVRL